MGASAGHLNQFLGSESIECHDVRSKRLRNGVNYVEAVDAFKQSPPQGVLDVDCCGTSANTKLLCRKRPLNEKENKLTDFDVISHQSGPSNDVLWVHKCGIRLNMQHMYIEHHGYCFDRVYTETDDSERIFTVDIAPQLRQVARDSKQCCVMAYGATGSGKTFTMEALSLLCANFLLAEVGAEGGLEVTCLEIARDRVYDLLGKPEISDSTHGTISANAGEEVTGLKEVALMDNESGDTELVGGVLRCTVSSMAEFAQVQRDVAALRTTRRTGVHDHSSRSHLVLKVELSTGPVTTAGPASQAGVLYLVDLAGSEWAQDQQRHDSELIRESRAINSSLMVLKQCIKARIAHDVLAKGVFNTVAAPYRDCKLTRVLKGCLCNAAHAVVVIGAVGPCSSDTEHSMATAANICRPSLSAVRAQESVDATTAAAATTNALSGLFFLVSNVKGRAQLNWDTTDASDDGATGAGAQEDAAGSVVCASESDAVADWSSARVCGWFVQTFGEVLEELNADSGAALAAAPQVGSVTVRMGAKQWVRLRLEGSGGEHGDSVGLSFQKSAAQATTVLKVLNKGYVKMLRMNTLRPGYRLIKVDSTRGDLTLKSHAPGADTRANILDDLKSVLRVFKQVVREQRAYEDVRVRYLTADMKVLREYVLNGQAPPLPSTGTEVAEEASEPKQKEGVETSIAAAVPPEPPLVAQDGAASADTLPVEPADMELVLTFEKNRDPNTRYNTNNLLYFGGASPEMGANEVSSEAATAVCTHVPVVPRIFTGESRTGEVWTGKELVEKFAQAKEGLNRMVTACDNNRLFGERVHQKLLSAIEQLPAK